MMTAMPTQDAAPPEIEDIAAQLEEYLSRPILLGGPLEPRPPEYDIIDAVRKDQHSEDAKFKLSAAASRLLSVYTKRIDEGDLSAEMSSRMARLGYLCSTLRLDVDGTPFYLLGLLLIQAASFGRTVDVQDLFQILRAAGRSDVPKVPFRMRELFWQSALEAPHKGLRTLAAQNLVRLNPEVALRGLPRLLAANVNEALVAHEFLQQLGITDLVNAATKDLDAATLRRMRQALTDAGHSQAAEAISVWEAEAASEMTSRSIPEATTKSFRLEVDTRSQVVAVRGGPVIFGLVASRRSTTVMRFMSRGGIDLPQAYLAAVAGDQDHLHPPALVSA